MPRNEAYRIPSNQVRIFQKQAKELVNGPYDCPNCGKRQLQIIINSSGRALQCAV
jgi:hypothetical protein